MGSSLVEKLFSSCIAMTSVLLLRVLDFFAHVEKCVDELTTSWL